MSIPSFYVGLRGTGSRVLSGKVARVKGNQSLSELFNNRHVADAETHFRVV